MMLDTVPLNCTSRFMVLQSFFLVTVVLGKYWLTVFFIESFYPDDMTI